MDHLDWNSLVEESKMEKQDIAKLLGISRYTLYLFLHNKIQLEYQKRIKLKTILEHAIASRKELEMLVK